MEETYSIELTQTQLNYIGNVLGEKPYKDVASLIAHINNEVNKPKEVPDEQE